LKSSPNTLFFVDESTGWLVADDGVYVTLESGRAWQKLKGAPDEIARVYFKDRQHGWGFGAKKALFETFDGGRKWTPVLAAAGPASRPEFSAYLWMDFANPKTGILVGNGRPPRPGSQNDLPPWLDPASAERRPEWPSVSLFLETHDGGSTWSPKTASLFGAITRLRLLPNGMGLALFEFQGRFDFPSEVLRLDLTSGRSESCLRRRDRATTDILLTADGTAYAAGYEPPGRINSLPIPGKVRILKSDQPDRRLWQEMPVDYRAVARRVYLSAPSPADVWAATDTGMILKLSTGSEPQTAKH
jgi:sulfur transfer complex TusBCD TusB component (DsrH family)